MKIIPKFQTGGAALPFADYMPYSVSPTEKTAASTATDDKNTEDIGWKDILKLAGEVKGLPSDTNKIVESLRSLYDNANLYTNGALSTDKLVTTYLSALQQLKIAEFNEGQFEAAYKTVLANDGLHEWAIDENGKIFCQKVDGTGYKKLSLSELYNQSDYTPLTNSNLLLLRAEDPNMSFDNRVLPIVTNGIGQKKVTEMILQALSKIGTTELSKEGYTARQLDQISNGLNILADLSQNQHLNAEDIYGDNGLISLDGLYKTGLINKTQKDQINMALDYLWKAMPNNARTWLAAKSQNTENPTLGAHQLLTLLMFASQDTTSKFSLDFQKDLDIRGKKLATKTSDSDKTNHYISMQNKEGGSYGQFELNSGTNNSLIVSGTLYGSLQDINGKPVEPTSVSNLLSKGLGSIVQNQNGIAFGDHVLSPTDQQNLWYDGSGGMMVDLPCKTVNGAKTVDLSVLDDYNAAYEEFKSLPKDQQTEENFGQLLSNKGLDHLLTADGLPDKTRFEQFLVTTAYGVDKNRSLYLNDYGQKNKYLEEVDTSNEELMNVIQQGLSTDSKKSNYTIDTESWFESSDPDGIFTYDHVYKGTLYIPISNNEVQGHNAVGQKLDHSTIQEDEYRYLLEQKRRAAKPTDTSLLYN